MRGCLLVTVSNLDQPQLGPLITENLEACWKCCPPHPSHRHRDRGYADDRRNPRSVAAVRRIQVAKKARRVVPTWIYQGIQPLPREQRANLCVQVSNVTIRGTAGRILVRILRSW